MRTMTETHWPEALASEVMRLREEVATIEARTVERIAWWLDEGVECAEDARDLVQADELRHLAEGVSAGLWRDDE